MNRRQVLNKLFVANFVANFVDEVQDEVRDEVAGIVDRGP